jgi:hypothetical protein
MEMGKINAQTLSRHAPRYPFMLIMGLPVIVIISVPTAHYCFESRCQQEFS